MALTGARQRADECVASFRGDGERNDKLVRAAISPSTARSSIKLELQLALEEARSGHLPGGATEATMMAHDFTLKLITGLVRAEVVTMEDAGGRATDVTPVRIIDAGRRELAEGR